MTYFLFNRMLARGHKAESLRTVFVEATQSIEDRYNPMVDTKNTAKSEISSDDAIFFHIPYHPRDISRQKIRDIYEKTCENGPSGSNFKCMTNDMTGSFMQISKLTVAYSRPKNLRDLLCPSKLVETAAINVSRYVK